MQQLAPGLVVQHSFSNKPPNGYENYYEKMTRYIEVISAPAKALDPKADARTFKLIESSDDGSVFRYFDTALSRAGIMPLSANLVPFGERGILQTPRFVLLLAAPRRASLSLARRALPSGTVVRCGCAAAREGRGRRACDIWACNW
jgi:hypothetical protein